MSRQPDIRMGRSRRTIRVLLSTILWVVAIVCFGLLAILGLGPRTGRYSTLSVLSGSMHPGIPIGAVVIDTPERPSALRVGQIITYAIPVDDHHVISHRVVKIVEAGDQPVFITKGDANNGPDPWQAKVTSTTMWRVRAVVPGLGTAIYWLRRPVVHKVGVIVVPIVLAVLWLIGIWRHEPNEAAAPAAQ